MVLKMAGIIGKDDGSEADQGKWDGVKHIFIGLLAACIIVLFIVPMIMGESTQTLYGSDGCLDAPYTFEPHDGNCRISGATITSQECGSLGGTPEGGLSGLDVGLCYMRVVDVENSASQAVNQVSGVITGIARDVMNVIGIILGVAAAGVGLVMRVRI